MSTALMERRSPGGWNLNDPAERQRAIANARAVPLPRRPVAVYTGDIQQDRLAVGMELGIDGNTWNNITNGVRWPEIVRLRREVSDRLVSFGYTLSEVAPVCGMAYTTILHHKTATTNGAPPFSPDEGFRRACEAAGVTADRVGDILSTCRNKEIVAIRAELAYRIRMMGFSWPSVARAFRRRSHAAFLVGARRYAKAVGLPSP